MKWRSNEDVVKAWWPSVRKRRKEEPEKTRRDSLPCSHFLSSSHFYLLNLLKTLRSRMKKTTTNPYPSPHRILALGPWPIYILFIHLYFYSLIYLLILGS
ncbi:hypothetical protein Lalb_Chr05g0226371 [Lupinus albus]|uniref:Uncharacterized protein n=1 Tax=Lupinus albus TaxID=3870 RepID=A0A6A4QK19_LUPAL|nr:hypothetical protein Lalb_Chr05g0226371 [Lupinus albus]